ncbi:MFS transporter [Halorussus litoreus]|uniref:MFS transporter n=1 Tax=Halorussus litoreus TaxID=1710536 RepID=UPI000E21EED8|nr:MFS transporter [Halorussus litoreus]
MGDLRSNRDFIGLLAGRIITNIGDSLYTIAAMWYVHELTSSPFYTGVAGFLLNLPRLFQFLVGPLVDRFPVRRILVATQLTQAVLVLSIPFIALQYELSVWYVIGLIPMLAMLNQFVYPAQNAALPRIVPQESLTKANSLFSFSYRSVDIIGQAIGGLLVAAIGAVSIYVIDSITFLLACACFAAVSVGVNGDDTDEDEDGDSQTQDYRSELREGIQFVWNSSLRYIILSAVVANFAMGLSIAILPAFADSYGGANVYGYLMASVSANILVGSLLASKLESYPFSRIQALMFAFSAVLWFASVFMGNVWLTIVIFGLAWVPVGVYNVMIQTIRQTAVPEDLIGRVTSVAVSGSALAAPLGSISGGAIAEVIGVRLTLAGVSLCFLPVVVIFATHPQLRNLPSLASISPDDIVLETSKSS